MSGLCLISARKICRQLKSYQQETTRRITASLCTPASSGSFALLSEDIVNWAVYNDDNDIEGILFVLSGGTVLKYKANYNIFSPNPPMAVGGRIIGFRV